MTPLRIRRRLAVLLLAAAPVLALIPSSANALIPNDQYEYWVHTRMDLDVIDREPTGGDELCDFFGTTSQYVKPADGTVPLGDGVQGVDYPADTGPFRHPRGHTYPYSCDGEVSVCFTEVTATIALDGVLALRLRIALYDSDQGDPRDPIDAKPCLPNDLENQSVMTFYVAPGTTDCLTFRISSPRSSPPGDGGQATFNLCVYDWRHTPASPVALDDLTCESDNSYFFCDAVISGGTPPITVRWRVGNQPRPAFDDEDSIHGPCAAETVLLVRVNVADNSGAAHQLTRSVQCRAIGS